MASKTLTRRDALKGLGATAAVQACGDSGDTGGGGTGGGGVGGGGGEGGGPPEDFQGITHVVVLMMENRSYDHYLGARKLEGLEGDGLDETMSNLNAAGEEQPIYRESILCVADPPHGWDASHAQFNGGMNDGFVTEYQAKEGPEIDPHVMGYFIREDLPVTYALADEYTSCDRWFCSVMGPTWPNRFYFHCAESGGMKTNDALPELVPTIYDRCDEKGISWEYYFTDLPFLLLIGGKHQQAVAPNFFDQAAAGTLPRLSVVDPGFALNDDHPPHHPGLGQQFIASIYQALATSPLWKNVLFVVTYDEHGGFFDHVAPPTAADDRAAEGFDQLGFRVPTLIIGPYVKKNYVSSVVYDHTSILKHIETMFDLEPLTARDAAATDLSDAIDQDRLAALEPADPITLPVVDVDVDEIDPMCKTMIRSAQPSDEHHIPHDPSSKSDIELWADRGLIPKELDLRHRNRETAFYIGDYLEKHGLGSVRRPKP